MADLKDIHDFILLVNDKERGGDLIHADIDAALDRAQMEVLNEYRELSRRNGKLHNDLVVFKTVLPFSKNYIDLPADYIGAANGTDYPDVQTATYVNGKGAIPADVRILERNELVNALQSQLRPVSASYPIGVFSGDGGANKKGAIQLYPLDEPVGGYLYYLRRPQAPKYVFTMVGRVETYDPLTSKQIEFSDTALDKIIFKAVSVLGINLNEVQQVQYGEMKQKEAV